MKEGSNISIATMVSLTIPICSVLGFCYATGYYQELGCQWVISLLTIQQIIMHSAIVSFFFIIPMILVAGMLFSGIKFWKILAGQTALNVLIAFFLFAGWLISDLDRSLIGVVLSISIISLYASVVAHASVVFSTGRTHEFRESLIFSMIGMIVIIAASTHTGQSYARYQFINKDRFFPTIRNGTYGANQLLLSTAGTSFLIANMKDGKIADFKLTSSIQSYAITTSKRPE
ncbi:hypothetical protein [Pseudomonas oryzihabitans]|uniref:hypothetical protein n=1 Tax=Pseudomonas oryzihabitans TaxID=47885 RepID=UPI0015E28F36|nr:hypothetical protein [Pseudomonas psychrotolerans]MBA1257639.1 hypothetical protein [Pseudomonas psychrotolerans]